MASFPFSFPGPFGGDSLTGPTAEQTVAIVSQPRDLQIDLDSGELLIVDGDLVLVSGEESIQQDLTCALRFFKGEWFDDLDAGVDYLGEFADKVTSDERRRAMVQAAALDVLGVVSVQSLSLVVNPSTRVARIDMGVASVVGPVTVATSAP